MVKKMNGIQFARRISLGVFLAVFTVLTILHQRVQNMPSVDSLDPFGGIETLFKYLAGGELIKKIMPANLVLLAAIVVLGVVLSRFFCGWICAFGALQGVFGWFGRKIFKKRFVVTPKVDRVLRWVKYPLLAGIVFFTWNTGTLIISPYDPLAAYAHLSAGLGAVWAEFSMGFVLLVVTLALSTLYERAFCKYLCPLGAVNAILGRIPLFRIKRESKTCISCSKCDYVCPMNIEVSTADTISSPECIGCLECVTACPTKKNTLVTTLAGKSVKAVKIVVLGLAIYLGSMGVGALLGTRDFVGPTLAAKAQTGELKVEDIKGSSTWAQVAESFGVELERLFSKAKVDGKKVPPETKLKDTGALIGRSFEADEARFAVATILGIPYSGESGTATTVAGSTAQTTSTAAAPAPAAPAAVAPAAPASATTIASPASSSASAALVVPSGFALEGTMTIRDVAAALKATETAVIAKLQLPADIAVDKPLRDLKDQYGYTMPDLKARLAK
ncbi:MAG: 4Fe-4S binding protein [Spirochaetes bacterium]|nr:4Fe-4S binding protein [Spirochaetota bacterium]